MKIKYLKMSLLITFLFLFNSGCSMQKIVLENEASQIEKKYFLGMIFSGYTHPAKLYDEIENVNLKSIDSSYYIGYFKNNQLIKFEKFFQNEKIMEFEYFYDVDGNFLNYIQILPKN